MKYAVFLLGTVIVFGAGQAFADGFSGNDILGSVISETTEEKNAATVSRDSEDTTARESIDKKLEEMRKTENLEVSVKNADMLYEKGELVRALKLYRSLFAQNEKLEKAPDMLARMAVIYSKLGNYESSIETYKLIIRNYGKGFKYADMWLVKYWIQENYINDCVENEDYRKLSQVTEQAEKYRNFFKNDPNEQAMSERILSFVKLENLKNEIKDYDLEKAVQSLDELRKSCKDTEVVSVINHHKAYIFANNKKYDEAVKLYETLLQTNPDYKNKDAALEKLGNLYIYMGEKEKGWKCFSRIMKECKGSVYIPEILYYSGAMNFENKSYQKAEEIFYHFLLRFPEHPREKYAYEYLEKIMKIKK